MLGSYWAKAGHASPCSPINSSTGCAPSSSAPPHLPKLRRSLSPPPFSPGLRSRGKPTAPCLSLAGQVPRERDRALRSRPQSWAMPLPSRFLQEPGRGGFRLLLARARVRAPLEDRSLRLARVAVAAGNPSRARALGHPIPLPGRGSPRALSRAAATALAAFLGSARALRPPHPFPGRGRCGGSESLGRARALASAVPRAGYPLAARPQGPLSPCNGPRATHAQQRGGARAGAATAGRRRRRRHCEGGREGASKAGPPSPWFPPLPPSPPRPPPRGRAAERREEEVEEAEEGAREGGSARPPAAGAAAAAASAAAERGAAEHGAGAAVAAAGIPEARAALRAPSW